MERRGSTGVYDFFNNNFFVFGGDQYYDIYFGETFFVHLDLGTVDTPNWQSQPMLSIAPSLFIKTISSGSVRIRYLLPKICNVNVKILDANGRVVKNLFSGRINSPSSGLYWDMNNNSGENVSSGVYYCLLETEDTKISKKFVIAK